MNFDPTFWLLIITCLLISFPISISMNKSLKKKFRKIKPFTWGYFTAWMGALSGTLLGVSQLATAMDTSGDHSKTIALFGLFFLITAVVHVFMIKRKRWAWLVGIILQLNPILWIINGIYLKNRWDEMGTKSEKTATTKRFK